jgi:hypothetical protein
MIMRLIVLCQIFLDLFDLYIHGHTFGGENWALSFSFSSLETKSLQTFTFFNKRNRLQKLSIINRSIHKGITKVVKRS